MRTYGPHGTSPYVGIMSPENIAAKTRLIRTFARWDPIGRLAFCSLYVFPFAIFYSLIAGQHPPSHWEDKHSPWLSLLWKVSRESVSSKLGICRRWSFKHSAPELTMHFVTESIYIHQMSGLFMRRKIRVRRTRYAEEQFARQDNTTSEPERRLKSNRWPRHTPWRSSNL